MITDEFSGRTDISRQRISQLRRVRDGLCGDCGTEPLFKSERCEFDYLRHQVRVREYNRKRFGYKRRYRNSLTYLFEEILKLAIQK